MNRMEVSQKEQDSRLSTDSPESRAVNLEREVGAGNNILTLEHPPPKDLLNVSPLTYFSIRRQQQQAGVEGLPARFADPGINMSQASDPGAYWVGLPAEYHPAIGISN
ncbi:unnamed protein product [Albugo candida]|uniref:Uncharacterized protein n=1 Tax=Albugo candida TaxID=65357 RepID=A0A024G5U8_9STRA|nr:unnamed protein product [Albugo candida]|eukprot:CCI41695.1 unnamed protein product [Albugo candida]